MLVKYTDHGQCRMIIFDHPKPTNPFSREMMNDLSDVLAKTEEDNDITSIILYGGDGRSFSAGGDFAQVIRLGDWESVSSMLNLIVDLYANILAVTKPVVAAIDNHAIGMGFQIALLADYRISTNRARFGMPELKNGIACTLGGVILEFMLGRKAMMDICYDCLNLSAEQCSHLGIVNDITDKNLIEAAIAKAEFYGSYPNNAFRNTKRLNNRRFLDVLEGAREGTVEAHYLTLSGKGHIDYMKGILGSDQPS